MRPLSPRICLVLSYDNQVPMSAISFIDVKRAWSKSCMGFTADPEGTPRDHGFCSYTVLESCQPSVLVVPDATKELRFCHNPFVTGLANIRFYAGAPIVVQGLKIGSLCIMDSVPRNDFTDAKALMLQELADLVALMIEERRVKVLEQEEELAKLIIGVNHHLKGPLKALSALSQTLSTDFHSAAPLEQLVRGVDKLYLQVEQFHEQVEIALAAASAYDRAKRSIKPCLPSEQAVSQAIPDLPYVRGVDLVDVLQQSGCLSQHLAGHVEWEICQVLEHGEVRADVSRLGVVLSSTMTLGAHGCERMKMNCCIEGAGEDEQVHPSQQERLGRLVVNITMSRPKPQKPPAPMSGFIFTGMIVPNILSPRVVTAADPTVIDNAVIQQCNEVICSAILQAEHGGYRQQKTSFMDMEILLISCWLPCKYRVSKEHEAAQQAVWAMENKISSVEASGMAMIAEGEEEEEDDEDCKRRRRSPMTSATSTASMVDSEKWRSKEEEETIRITVTKKTTPKSARALAVEQEQAALLLKAKAKRSWFAHFCWFGGQANGKRNQVLPSS